MKYLLASLSSAILLGGCVTVPYDADTGYHATYPTTVAVQGNSGYYYPDRAYPYAAPSYSYPNSPYPYYQPYQPPVYSPPAPVVVPPSIEFRYDRNARPDLHEQHPHHDSFRNGPSPQGNHPVAPQPQWGYRNDAHPDWLRREGPRHELEQHGDRSGHWQPDGAREDFHRR